jgi:hypothetical protein
VLRPNCSLTHNCLYEGSGAPQYYGVGAQHGVGPRRRVNSRTRSALAPARVFEIRHKTRSEDVAPPPSPDWLAPVTSRPFVPTFAAMPFWQPSIHPEHRQSAIRAHARTEILCEAKARQRLVWPKPGQRRRAIWKPLAAPFRRLIQRGPWSCPPHRGWRRTVGPSRLAPRFRCTPARLRSSTFSSMSPARGSESVERRTAVSTSPIRAKVIAGNGAA